MIFKTFEKIGLFSMMTQSKNRTSAICIFKKEKQKETKITELNVRLLSFKT